MKYLETARMNTANDRCERVVITLDVSGSMDEKDYPPTRLGAGIESILALIEIKSRDYGNDECGIVSFSSDARVVHPLVPVDTGGSSLARTVKSMKSGGATNIHAGLRQSGICLFGNGGFSTTHTPAWVSKVSKWLFDEPQFPDMSSSESGCLSRIILLGDGANTTGIHPVIMANELKSRGVIIDCIGIGGSPKDVDEKTLKEIASRNADGSIRYWFIGDKGNLIRKFKDLGNRIRAI